MSNIDNSISFEIQERIGTIAVYPTGWSKELNLVSWNGGAPKYDIRLVSGSRVHVQRHRP